MTEFTTDNLKALAELCGVSVYAHIASGILFIDTHGNTLTDGDHWNPPENIEQAFMVVEALSQDYWFDLDSLDRWTAVFNWREQIRPDKFTKEYLRPTGTGETPAAAICAAALKAIQADP